MRAPHRSKALTAGVSVWVLTVLLTALLGRTGLVQAESSAVAGPGPLSTPFTSAAPVAEADALFSYGEDPARDLQALATLARALVTDVHDYQLLWRAARAYYQVGNDASDAEKQRYFEHGMAMGQRAVAQQPSGAEGHFWLAANYGGLSEIQGIWRALQMVKKVRSEMETALRLQPDYEDGNAYRALGEIARQLPGVLGGNLQRALTYFEQGVRVAPQNMAIKFALARAYLEAGQREASQRLVTEILQMPVRPARAQADRRTQDKARQLGRQ
ncbi:MAG TPA: TRAP transporter TatT component family protein [Candidatus Tectomicrobia bacterium]